jgi:single-stranded DNA-specific DHH superfamily exonuclease
MVRDLMKEALAGLRGHGGGHEHACGMMLDKDDLPEFLKRINALLKSEG